MCHENYLQVIKKRIERLCAGCDTGIRVVEKMKKRILVSIR